MGWGKRPRGAAGANGWLSGGDLAAQKTRGHTQRRRLPATGLVEGQGHASRDEE